MSDPNNQIPLQPYPQQPQGSPTQSAAPQQYPTQAPYVQAPGSDPNAPYAAPAAAPQQSAPHDENGAQPQYVQPGQFGQPAPYGQGPYAQTPYAQAPGSDPNAPYAAPAAAPQQPDGAHQDPGATVPGQQMSPQPFGPDSQPFVQPMPMGAGMPGAPATKPRKSKTGLIVGIIVAVVAVIAVIALVAAFVIPRFLKPTAQDFNDAWNTSTRISDSYYNVNTRFGDIIYATSAEDIGNVDAQSVKDDLKAMQDTIGEIESMKAAKDADVKAKLDAAKPAVDNYATFITNIVDTAPAYGNALSACSSESTYSYSDFKAMEKSLEDCSAALTELGKSKDESFAKFGKDSAAEYAKAIDLVKQLESLGSMDSWSYDSPNWDKYSNLSSEYSKIDFYSIESKFSEDITNAEKKVDPSNAINDLTDTLSDKMLGR